MNENAVHSLDTVFTHMQTHRQKTALEKSVIDALFELKIEYQITIKDMFNMGW